MNLVMIKEKQTKKRACIQVCKLICVFVGCRPACDTCCPALSSLDQKNCKCICISGYTIGSDNTCVPINATTTKPIYR